MNIEAEIPILFATNLIICVVFTALFMIIPRLTRKSYLFGVKIPLEEADSAEAMQLRKRYITTCLFGGVILFLMCIVQFLLWRNMTLAVTLYLPFLSIALYFAAFIPNWKRAVRLKEARGWAVSNAVFAETSSSHTRGRLSSLPYLWYVCGFIFVLAAIIATIVQYPAAPELLPVHFDLQMIPDQWAEKTWWTALQMPLINAGFFLLMFFVAIGVIKVRLQIDPDNPRLSFAQHHVYRKRIGHTFGFLTFVITLLLAALSLLTMIPEVLHWVTAEGSFFPWLMIALLILSVASIFVVLIKTGQGGCKVKIPAGAAENAESTSIISESKIAGRGDDRYWRLGLFYYNPDDPAYFVEDRFGANLGFNYARLPVKIGIALLVLGLIALYAWLTVTLL